MKWRTVRRLRGLCVDIENKPGTYGPGDYTHGKVTAIGCDWADRKPGSAPPTSLSEVGTGKAWILDRVDVDAMRESCQEFRALWDEADFIIGHNFRRHDMKLLDGLFFTLDLPLLERKRIVDTYLDQPKVQGLSRSLENLAERWGCPVKKLHMPEHVWEAAYDGTPEGQFMMKRRVLSDVSVNIWLWYELVERGLL